MPPRDVVEIGRAVLCSARRGDSNYAVSGARVAPFPVAVVTRFARGLVGRARARVRSAAKPVIFAPVDGRTRRRVERLAGVIPLLRHRVLGDGGVSAGAEHRRVHRGDERLATAVRKRAILVTVARRFVITERSAPGIAGYKTVHLIRQTAALRAPKHRLVVRGVHVAPPRLTIPRALVRRSRRTRLFVIPVAHLIRAIKVAKRGENGPSRHTAIPRAVGVHRGHLDAGIRAHYAIVRAGRRVVVPAIIARRVARAVGDERVRVAVATGTSRR
mmetsp:Transcript_7556/g.31420  ORF Transcript_7556/g.31420 Transcript_7556/m.31420 type:complete len:273 (-) Transcript_7556:25-843(-)